MSDLKLDAEGLYLELKRGVQRLLTADTALVGIWGGGAWLAERLSEFTDVHPEFETPVERFATWLARLDDPED